MYGQMEDWETSKQSIHEIVNSICQSIFLCCHIRGPDAGGSSVCPLSAERKDKYAESVCGLASGPVKALPSAQQKFP